MKKIQSDETSLAGQWIEENGSVKADDVCERIDWLTKNCLKKMANSKKNGDWEIIYLDPEDGRYWEKTYPQSEMQGGGPATLICISEDEAKNKYDF